MRTLADGYGGAWHLFHYLGRHREMLNQRVKRAVGAKSVQWLDSDSFDVEEWRGLEFWNGGQAEYLWKRWWPQDEPVPLWHAVGRVEIAGEPAWLLVVAQSYLSELEGDLETVSEENRKQITDFLDRTKESLGVSPDADWETGFYQHAGRLAVLHFLHRNQVSAHLLFIYFVGDQVPKSDTQCPQSSEEWEATLKQMGKQLGIPEGSQISGKVHELFLHVQGIPVAGRCPECGSMRSIPIMYGYPGEELWEMEDRGEAVIGGCCPEGPNWQCKECGARWDSF